MESKSAVSPCLEPTPDAKREVAVSDPPEEEVLYDDFVHYRVAAVSRGCSSGSRGKPVDGKKDNEGSMEEKRAEEDGGKEEEDGGKEEEDYGEKQADADADESSSSSSRTIQASELTTGEGGIHCVKGGRLTKFEREHLASTRGLQSNVKFLTSTYLGKPFKI